MTRSRLLWLTLAAALLAGVVAASTTRLRKPSVSVTYADASRGPIAREVLTSGTLQPAREVEVGAQVSGTVLALHADFNSTVKAGQIIAQLDPSTFDTDLAQARAKLIQAEADVEQKQVLLDDASVKGKRAEELVAQDLISRAEADAAIFAAREAGAALTSSRAAAKAARAAVDQAVVNRSHTVIRSPIDGIVVSRNVEVGQTLAARLEAPVLFRIADLRAMQMMTDVSEAEVGGVRRGTEVTFEIESLGRRQFKGTVTEVRLQPVLVTGTTGTTGGGATASGAVATTGTTGASRPAGATSPSTGSSATNAPGAATTPGAAAQTSSAASTTPAAPAGSVVSYTAIVNVDNADERIAPGTTAVVTLPTARRENALRVPNNALAFRPTPDQLERTGQSSLEVPVPEPMDDPVKGRAGYVWKFEGGRFVPLEVRAGVSDETWTEILSGDVKIGDRLVTGATR
jgi:HlyD family secretion protein